MYKITKSIVLFWMILSLSSCAGPVVMEVQQSAIEGNIIDVVTKKPIKNALIIETIARGGFWSMPSTYDLRQVYTDENGHFVLAANPKVLLNVSDPGEPSGIGIFARGYQYFVIVRTNPSEKETAPLHVELTSGKISRDPCIDQYFTRKTCALIRAHVGW